MSDATIGLVAFAIYLTVYTVSRLLRYWLGPETFRERFGFTYRDRYPVVQRFGHRCVWLSILVGACFLDDDSDSRAEFIVLATLTFGFGLSLGHVLGMQDEEENQRKRRELIAARKSQDP